MEMETLEQIRPSMGEDQRPLNPTADLGQSDPNSKIVIVDISCFLYKNRLDFLLNILQETPELKPDIVGVTSTNLEFLQKLSVGDLGEFWRSYLAEIVRTYEGTPVGGVRFERIKSWLTSDSFRIRLKDFFTLNILDTTNIGFGRDGGSRETKEELEQESLLNRVKQAVVDGASELFETTKRLKTSIIALGSGLRRVLRRAGYYFIELPHAKKMIWFKRFKFFGKVFFAFFVGGSANTLQNLGQAGIVLYLEKLLSTANPYLTQILSSVDLHSLAAIMAPFISQILPIFLAGGVAYLSIAILFDSLEAIGWPHKT